MRRISSAVVVAVVLTAAAATPSYAQNPPPGEEGSRVGAGFVVLNHPDQEFTTNGFGIDFAHPVNFGGQRRWSIVGDLAWTRGNDETDVNFGGGLRFTTAAGSRASVFVQGTVGYARWSVTDCCDDQAIYFGPGGGVLVPITGKVDVKGQMDFLIPNWDGYDDRLLRFFFGVAIRVSR